MLGLGFLIQITGINAVVFYSPLIFKDMGFSGNSALLLLPALVQVGSLVATVVSLSVVDRIGRRPTLLTGIAAMVGSTVLLAIVFAVGRPDRRGRLARLRRHLRVHGGLQLRLRLARVGLRVRELPGAPAHDRRIGDADGRPAWPNLIIGLYFLSALESLGGTATFLMFAALAAISFAFVW